jgi:hypothetical protein
MRKRIVCLLLFTFSFSVFATGQEKGVFVKKIGDEFKITINRKPFFIKGMNWDYYPIGTNYTYSLWSQPDRLIKAALDYEMQLLKNMGVNTIRQYSGVPAKWIQYIYETYGIYTVLNHTFGRYGLTLKGNWEANTDYSNPLVRELLVKEVKELADHVRLETETGDDIADKIVYATGYAPKQFL